MIKLVSYHVKKYRAKRRTLTWKIDQSLKAVLGSSVLQRKGFQPFSSVVKDTFPSYSFVFDSLLASCFLL
ncbi:unnamed protein product [Rhizophagus irregularis]|nr:unnamed protein product [Rhizophagus irregularis]